MYVTHSVPFQMARNLSVLTDMQISKQPWIADFIATFQSCFERDNLACWWVYLPKRDDVHAGIRAKTLTL